MNLFRSFVRCVLIEGRIDDLLKKYPEVPRELIDELNAADPSPTKKYLQWMVKQVDAGFTALDIIPSIQFFHRNPNKFTKRDINQYRDVKELEDEVKKASEKVSSTEQRRQIKAAGAKNIMENDEYNIIRIDSKAAAQQYGAGTKWCITMSGQSYYEQYTKDNVIFHFILRKKPIGDKFDKIAAASIRDANNRIRDTEYYDAEDHKFNARRTIDPAILSEISVDAERQPKGFLAKLKSGDQVSDEEIKQYWTGLDSLSEKEKRIAQWSYFGLIPEARRKILIPLIDDEVLLDVISGKANFEFIEDDYYEDEPDTRDDQYNYETIEYRNQSGDLHRIDGPAVIQADGGLSWWQNGKEHRLDGPSTIEANGYKTWVQWGKLHREDGPAMINSNGTEEWFLNGERHREDGPAIIRPDGTNEWFLNGQRHRIGGPASTYRNNEESKNIQKRWWQFGKLHRLDGPAWTGSGQDLYYIDGINYSPSEYFEFIKDLK